MRRLTRLGFLLFICAVSLLLNKTAYAEPGHGEHDRHGHDDGDHMQHMNEVKTMLQKKLGEKYDTPLLETELGDKIAGKVVYGKFCASCHGEKGMGDGPIAKGLPSAPANFTDAAHSNFYSPRGRLWIIENGVPNTPMVGWKSSMSKKKLFDVFAYVRSLAESDKTNDTKEEHEGHHHGHDHKH